LDFNLSNHLPMRQEIEKECVFRNLFEQAWENRRRNLFCGEKSLGKKKC